jgi:hypothetical protein
MHSSSDRAVEPAVVNRIKLRRARGRAETACRVAGLVFWAIVGGLRNQKTKEESQPPVRAKAGVHVGAV